MPNDIYRKRHLPHQIPSNVPIFLTWNLKGAISIRLLHQLETEAARLLGQPKRQGESDHQRKNRHAKLLFRMRDKALDLEYSTFWQTTGGQTAGRPAKSYVWNDRPMWLADPAAASQIVQSFFWGVESRYQLWAFVVMGNHVHGLLTPQVDLEIITQGIKGYTAYQINRLQKRTGSVFWQGESYDHWVRDNDEFYRIIEYIEQNPVVAGLCHAPELWRWSSAWFRSQLSWPRGTPLLKALTAQAVTLAGIPNADD